MAFSWDRGLLGKERARPRHLARHVSNSWRSVLGAFRAAGARRWLGSWSRCRGGWRKERSSSGSYRCVHEVCAVRGCSGTPHNLRPSAIPQGLGLRCATCAAWGTGEEASMPTWAAAGLRALPGGTVSKSWEKSQEGPLSCVLHLRRGRCKLSANSVKRGCISNLFCDWALTQLR